MGRQSKYRSKEDQIKNMEAMYQKYAEQGVWNSKAADVRHGTLRKQTVDSEYMLTTFLPDSSRGDETHP